MISVFGIPNCDTCRKTQKTLTEAGIAFQFHDFRKDGIDPSQISRWLKELGAEQLINKRSTTWRELDDEQRDLSDDSTTVALLHAQPTLIKRPVIQSDQALTVGFKKTTLADHGL